MKTRLLFAAVAMLPLAACGGGAEEAEAPEAAATSVTGDVGTEAEAAPSAAASATSDAGEPSAAPTPEASASATPSPTPTPTAAPTRVAAAPVAPPAAFAICGVCHAVTAGQNGVGPSLAGVIGRRAGTAAGYSYSPGMRSANITWNDGTLDRYLADPAAVVPGTAMPAPGIDAAQRRAIIAYLKTL